MTRILLLVKRREPPLSAILYPRRRLFLEVTLVPLTSPDESAGDGRTRILRILENIQNYFPPRRKYSG